MTPPSEPPMALFRRYGHFLSIREQKVLGLRLGVDGPPMTMAEAARAFRMTKARLRQIEDKARSRLSAMQSAGTPAADEIAAAIREAVNEKLEEAAKMAETPSVAAAIRALKETP